VERSASLAGELVSCTGTLLWPPSEIPFLVLRVSIQLLSQGICNKILASYLASYHCRSGLLSFADNAEYLFSVIIVVISISVNIYIWHFLEKECGSN